VARGRKVNSNGERSKKLLLEKAIELFSERGYHETKISDIVTAADLTQPTFYLYFQSKESIYKDLNTQFKNTFLEILQRDLAWDENSSSIIDDIKKCMTNLFTYFSNNPKLTIIGFYRSEEAHSIKETFAKILEKKISEVNYSDVDSKVVAESLVGSVERLTLSTLLKGIKIPEQLASDIINIYFVKQYA
jgi:AcrR family transcriptional regulator